MIERNYSKNTRLDQRQYVVKQAPTCDRRRLGVVDVSFLQTQECLRPIVVDAPEYL